MKIITLLLQTLFIVAIAPLLSGIILKIKNNLRMRKGAGLFQPYYNLAKLLAKEEVVSENASWVFTVTPAVLLGSAVAAVVLVPALVPGLNLNIMGDFLLLVFLLSAGRFFLSLAGLDTASAFGGMGSSREMFIAGLTEPVTLLAVFAVSLNSGSTSLALVGTGETLKLSGIIAAGALFIVTIVETSRVPVDNRETHLELTMVHEAMALEYSGPSLALVELAAHVKQIVLFSVLAAVSFPSGRAFAFTPAGAAAYMVKILLIGAAVAFIEITVAKMRLFRVPDFLSFALILAGIAVVVSAMGF